MKKIRYIDPTLGVIWLGPPTRDGIEVAERLGYEPADDEAQNMVKEIRGY